jgi:hypothetical protein
MKRSFAVSLAFLGLCLLAPQLPAQVGATTDIIAGTVLDAEGRPVVSADVEAISIDTGLRRSTMTNRSGRYTIVFPDGGGRYAVRITHIGLAPQEFLLERLADEDVLIADARMTVRAIAIEGIDVLAQRAEGEGERVEAGALEAAYTQEYLNRLPLEPGDFDAIAALTSGVLPVDGDEDVLGGFSVGGLSPELNAIVMDGAPIGSGGDGGIPEEGIRMSRVITNTYDVARGQFAGGQISVSTRGGTNTRGGSLSYTLQDRALQWNLPGNASDGWTQHRWSGGFGGPLIRDRLLYFVSGSAMQRSDPLHSLNTLGTAELARLGADPDSVGRFFDILDARYPGGQGSDPALDWRTNGNLNGMARIDWVASERHSVMARLNHRAGGREGIRTARCRWRQLRWRDGRPPRPARSPRSPPASTRGSSTSCGCRYPPTRATRSPTRSGRPGACGSSRRSRTEAAGSRTSPSVRAAPSPAGRGVRRSTWRTRRRCSSAVDATA